MSLFGFIIIEVNKVPKIVKIWNRNFDNIGINKLEKVFAGTIVIFMQFSGYNTSQAHFASIFHYWFLIQINFFSFFLEKFEIFFSKITYAGILQEIG